jgi:PIN like domain
LSNLKPLEPHGTLFLDCTHQSNIAIKLLKALGCSVERHKTHFLPDAPDDEWIPVCAKRNWVIISGDKGIIQDGINRAAVQESKAKVFILADTTAKGADWAAALASAARKILWLASANEGPFYCRVARPTDSHVGKVEYLPGGGPLTVSPIAESVIAVPEAVSSPTDSELPESDPPVQPDLGFPTQ